MRRHLHGGAGLPELEIHEEGLDPMPLPQATRTFVHLLSFSWESRASRRSSPPRLESWTATGRRRLPSREREEGRKAAQATATWRCSEIWEERRRR
nr:unnamed protein product [Digitaria exilis]